MNQTKASDTKVALYCRVSTNQQDFELQIQDLRKEAKRLGATIVKEYADKISGNTQSYDRLYAEEVIKDAQQKKFDTLLVWQLDRIARDEEFGLSYLRRIEETGCKINFLTQPYINTPNPHSEQGASIIKNSRTMLFMGSRMELQNIKNRVRGAKTQWLSSNKWSTPGYPPFGYLCDKDYQLKIIDKEARIVKMIFDMYVRKNYSSRRICRELNALGIKPPASSKWGKDSVMSILRRETYTGKSLVGEKLGKFSFICPPIITVANYQTAQEKKLERYTLSPRRSKRDYLLRGLLKCANCGYHLFPRFAGGYQNYEGLADGSTKRCNPICGRISERILAVALAEHLIKTILIATDKDINGWLKQEEIDVIDLKGIQDQTKKIDKDKERATSMCLNGLITESRLKVQLGELARQESVLLERIHQYQQKSLDSSERKKMITEITKFITVAKGKFLFKLIGGITIESSHQLDDELLEMVVENMSLPDLIKSGEIPYENVVEFVKYFRDKNFYQNIFVDFKKQELRVMVSFKPEDSSLLRLSNKN